MTTQTTHERRQLPRTTLERLAYIHIEPDNGGIVLNASVEGLCFQSIAPVERNGLFRFSLLDHSRPIEVCGELAWTDEIQKTGGLRFTPLSPELRGQINQWIGQAPETPPAGKFSKLKSLSRDKFLDVYTCLLNRAGRSDDPAVAATPLYRTVRRKLSGFSAGVLTGLLIAVLGGVIVLFSYAHRRELGESLIRWGQRLAARPEARRQVTIAGPQTAAPSPEPPSNKAVSSARSNAESPLVKPERGATPLVQRLENPAKPQQLSLNLPTAVIMPQRRSVPMLPNSLRTRAAEIAATHPPDSAAMFSRAPAVKPPPDKINSVVQLPLTNVTYAPPSVGSAPTLQMYFDLGKFRNELSAQDLREEVARLGLRTTVFHERHFWRDSYQVLVGPYSNEEEEKTIKNNLISHGYRARALERGSRSFAFSSRVTLNGSRLPAGDFTINWESYVADVRVKFMQNGQVIATAKGSWVPMSYRYIQNAFVSAVHPDGSRTLLQIWFSGFNRALVFHN